MTGNHCGYFDNPPLLTNTADTAENDKDMPPMIRILAQNTCRHTFVLWSGACSSLRMGLMRWSGNETVSRNGF